MKITTNDIKNQLTDLFNNYTPVCLYFKNKMMSPGIRMAQPNKMYYHFTRISKSKPDRDFSVIGLDLTEQTLAKDDIKSVRSFTVPVFSYDHAIQVVECRQGYIWLSKDVIDIQS